MDHVYKIKENFLHETIYNIYTNDWKDGKLEMQVEKAEVLDTVTGIEETFKTFAASDPLVDNAGNLLPYEREFGEWGDGINTPTWKTTETQMVNRRLLSITLKMKNTTGEAVNDMDIFPRLVLLTEENGSYEYLKGSYRNFNSSKEAYSMDTYGDGNNGKGFYFVDFDKDEEKLITISFLVDEDELNHAFLTYGGGDGLVSHYVDVRQ